MNKKILIISLIVLSLVVLAGLVVYLLSQKQPETIPPEAEKSEQEKIISRQLQELDGLRQRMGAQPLTEKEKQAQIKELDALHKQALSLAETQKQLEELKRLRLGR